MHKLLKFAVLLSLIFSSAFVSAMDFSGYDIKSEQFFPAEGRQTDLNSYTEHFKTLCPRKYGQNYRFSSYIEKQIPMSDAEKAQFNSLAEAAYKAKLMGRKDEFMFYRSMALEMIQNQKSEFFALCVFAGPSKKAAWKKNLDSARVDFELFLARMGYYNLKFQIINLFN